MAAGVGEKKKRKLERAARRVEKGRVEEGRRAEEDRVEGKGEVRMRDVAGAGEG